MKLKSIKNIKLNNKTVIVKVDYNVPLKKTSNGNIVVADDTRLKVTIPTLTYLLEQNCKIILMSHLGRPDNKWENDLKMAPVAVSLGELLGKKIFVSPQVIGQKTKEAISSLKNGEILMLENNRFEPGELINDPDLSKTLASYADIFINDGFSVSHRAHASVEGITRFIPSAAGLTLLKEVEMLSKLIQDPKRPLVSIVGGAKISDKIDAIKNLSKISDFILVGGGVANNFLKAEGVEIFSSYLQDVVVDEKKRGVDYVNFAKKLIKSTKNEKNLLNNYIPLPKIIYPVDVYAAESIENTKTKHLINLYEDNNSENKNIMYLDIGPKTQKLFQEIILEAETIFWNGPMGVFEKQEYEEGTKTIAQTLAKCKGTTVIGGGDTIRAIDQFGLMDRYDYVSASGGASLEFLGGKQLPGIKPLLI